VAASARIQSQQAAAAAAQASAQAQAAANAASAAAAAATAKSAAQGAQGAGAGVTEPNVSIPAMTVANNPTAVPTIANIPTASVAANGATTLSTQSSSTSVVRGVQLSMVAASGQNMATLSGGDTVAISSVTMALPSSVVAESTLTGVQNATGTDVPRPPSTTDAGNFNITGENIHTTAGLSKDAYIGIGIGFGFLALLIVFLAIWFRWNHRRQQKRNPINGRSPSVETTTASQGSIEDSGNPEYGRDDMTSFRELESSHHTPIASFRSPVSPFSAVSASNNPSLTRAHNIYELFGSGPVEMAGSPASPSGGVEMQGSPTAEEVAGSPTSCGLASRLPHSEAKASAESTAPAVTAVLEQDAADVASGHKENKSRPFSFVSSPTAEQFLSSCGSSDRERDAQD
jgi:hypothetical protein